MDTFSAAAARALLLLGLLGLDPAPASAAGKRQRHCPAACHCEHDGMLVRVDCSDLGLTSVPANLSVFASYLASEVVLCK
uniref:Leucine-rich repeat-containing G-protein coupled receptor 5 n=1 Tax=Sphaerodactylus townsendi TaxID=933632 RepID=A0ACB8FP43_9SAUR